MSTNTQLFLLKLYLIVSVSAHCLTNKLSNSGESEVSCLPASAVQKEYIATSVCTESLDLSVEYMYSCKQGWDNGWYLDEDMTGLRVRCRSANDGLASVTVEVSPSKSYQIVLLVTHPNDGDDDSVIYNIISPNDKFARLEVDAGTNYSMYSTVLNAVGAPLVWHQEPDILEWTPPPRRDYDIQIQFLTNNSADGLVSWNQTGELDECFELDTSCPKMSAYYFPSKTIWPDSPPNTTIKDLPSDDSCNIRLRGFYGITDFFFNTPAYKDPEFTWVASINLTHEVDGDTLTIHVTWPEPPVAPDSYNVSLWAADKNITITGLPANATEAYFRRVTGSGDYDVSVIAILGSMKAYHSVHGRFPERIVTRVSSSVFRWAVAAGVAWVTVALAAALYWLRACRANMLRRKMKVVRWEDGKLLSDSSHEESTELPPVADAWEIMPERLALHEVIGEGAFGVVRRGTLAPLGKEVAVKMLKDFPSMEEMREFRVEMELMKSVGAHRHVVSLVGCCTTRQPAIVAEYCSRGDLLNFLRFSWDIMLSKRNANYYNNNINISDYRNDLFKQKMPLKHTKLVVNKVYELKEVCDTELTSLDLLSFCRQIAMGMEFLALNKVVHRDLAARNILVTGDRTLKIADFGLSRDVYEENQYKQKGNGKLPVKWMALESLTRRIYTTQSDVWSFGVVAWEVMTVGGAPYAGVEAARLPRLLRSGYRMPRPPNCSSQLYELMRACWAARPRDRPTFAELHARLDELLNSASATEYISLELDDEPPPTPFPYKYLGLLLRAKRYWTRGESYEQPLKAPHNHYTLTPVICMPPV